MEGPGEGDRIVPNLKLARQIIVNYVTKWACSLRNTPKMIVNSSALELKANCQLDLTLPEERAVSSSGDAEYRIFRQTLREARGATRSGEVIQGGVYASDLRAVEEVEGFRQNLQPRSFGNVEPSRKAHVNVPNVRLLEEVARQETRSGGAARTVDAAARRRVGCEAISESA